MSLLNLEKCLSLTVSLLLLHRITLIGVIQSHVFCILQVAKALIIRMTHLVLYRSCPPGHPTLEISLLVEYPREFPREPPISG